MLPDTLHFINFMHNSRCLTAGNYGRWQIQYAYAHKYAYLGDMHSQLIPVYAYFGNMHSHADLTYAYSGNMHSQAISLYAYFQSMQCHSVIAS